MSTLESKTTKRIILCDLDGTLADCQHRIHHIVPNLRKERDANGAPINPLKKDWAAFFAACDDDSPIEHMITLLRTFDREAVEIWITSGRSDECWALTVDWLSRHDVPYDRLVMRKAGDFTDDGILKPSWLTDGTIPKERVLLALDDRNRVVKAWRESGVPCLQVAEGDF